MNRNSGSQYIGKNLLQKTKTWQQELSEGFNNIDKLCEYLNIPHEDKNLISCSSNFPLRVPREFAERMELSKKQANLLLNETTHITYETALKLESVLGSTVKFWLNREAQYRKKLREKGNEK